MDESLSDIDEAVKRLQRLVTQLLALARAEGDPEIMPRATTDVIASLRATCSRLAQAAHNSGLEMRFLGDGELLLPIEAILVDEMVGNVIDNAIKYHETGSNVLVSVTGRGLAGTIVVEDDGQGIPEGDAAQVGDRFFRVPRDQHRPGSGLGLSIAQAICERAGGTFAVAAASTGGMRVTFNFAPAISDTK